MKKLGLIGGTSPQSTAINYKEINEKIALKTENKAFPKIAIESINLFEALSYFDKNDYEGLTNFLLESINNLAKIGCECCALTANTLHVVFENLKNSSPIPIISIVETCLNEIRKQNFKKVGLLGTAFTMKNSFFQKPFEQCKIEVVVPNVSDLNLVNDIISNELEFGVVKEKSTSKLIEVIENMRKQQNIEAIILGCTELPLSLNKNNCAIPCFDTMAMHINSLIENIIK